MGYEYAIENEYIKLMFDGWYNEPTFLDEAVLTHRRTWWPRLCRLTHRWMWGKVAVRARRAHYNLSNKVFYEDRWYDSKEFMLYQLKGF